MITVLIADDHAMVREGLRRVLEADGAIRVIACVSDGEEAIAAARALGPDVVLMDLSMPGIGGIAATRAICQEGADVRVVMLTAFADRQRVIDSLDAGAIGYLLKSAPPEELVAGIHAAMAGGSPLTPEVARTVLQERSAAKPAGLSPREREVLQLIARGLPNKQIAIRLGITEKTVKTHVTSVLAKLGVFDRTQAALWAVENGYGA